MLLGLALFPSQIAIGIETGFFSGAVHDGFQQSFAEQGFKPDQSVSLEFVPKLPASRAGCPIPQAPKRQPSLCTRANSLAAVDASMVAFASLQPGYRLPKPYPSQAGFQPLGTHLDAPGCVEKCSPYQYRAVHFCLAEHAESRTLRTEKRPVTGLIVYLPRERPTGMDKHNLSEHKLRGVCSRRDALSFKHLPLVGLLLECTRAPRALTCRHQRIRVPA